jgi:hypothetical protein
MTRYISIIRTGIQILLITVQFFGVIHVTEAQRGFRYAPVNRIMSRIPDSQTYSTSQIADYIRSNFTTQREISRAVYVWVTRNIKYNFDSILTNSIYETPSQVSERILRTRTGVCLNYACLFNELSNKAGIKSFVVQGFTKQGNRVDFLPHVWCAGYIDSVWYLFDPTWGSGYVEGGKFVNQVNNFYFMTKPEDMIRSHMPFDPVWQLLNYPITHHEFKKGKVKMDTTRLFFNYPDTLNNYLHASNLDQAVSSARRIEMYGIENNFIAAKLRILKGEIEYYRNAMAAEKYESAVTSYNKGIGILNRFISHRNKHFKFLDDTVQLLQILDSTEYCFTIALKTLTDIEAPDESISSSILELQHAINGTMEALYEQRAFLLAYLRNRK